MTGNPMDSMHSFDRVSVRAVLVHDGEDPSAALAEAGILDPIVVPVIMGDDLDQSGGILGDGITPNLIGVLETEQEEAFESSFGGPPSSGGRDRSATEPDQPGTSMLPAAFGIQPLAPVRKIHG